MCSCGVFFLKLNRSVSIGYSILLTYSGMCCFFFVIKLSNKNQVERAAFNPVLEVSPFFRFVKFYCQIERFRVKWKRGHKAPFMLLQNDKPGSVSFRFSPEHSCHLSGLCITTGLYQSTLSEWLPKQLKERATPVSEFI